MTYPHVVQQPVRPSDVRPRRSWYWIAVAIVVATLAAGPGLFLLGGYDFFGPRIVAEFDTGSPTTARLTAGKQWGIYVDNPSPDPPENKIPTDCTVKAVDGGEVTVNPVGYSFYFEKDGRRWDLLGQVDVTRDGQYQFDCKGAFGDDGSYHYGVSDLAGFGGAAGAALGSAGLVAGIPCVGIVIALIIMIVTLVRRSGNKKKLQRQAAYPPPGFPPSPAYPPGYPPPGYPPSGYR